MRALLITKTGVEEVQIGPKVEKLQALIEDRAPAKEKLSNLESMYWLMECDTVTGAGYPNAHHACWADDNGLLFAENGTQATKVAWWPEPLVGKLLVTGFNPKTGDTTEATMSVAELQSMIKIGTLRYE